MLTKEEFKTVAVDIMSVVMQLENEEKELLQERFLQIRTARGSTDTINNSSTLKQFFSEKEAISLAKNSAVSLPVTGKHFSDASSSLRREIPFFCACG